MSKRTAQANKAIASAWKREQQLIQEGKGTRDWTEEEQKDILERGKAYDKNGKAFEGHHMKSVEQYPEYQEKPDNIQFLTRQEHLEAHNGNFQNSTNGCYDPLTGVTKDFMNGLYEPCKIINLSNPIISLPSNFLEEFEQNSNTAKTTTKSQKSVFSNKSLKISDTKDIKLTQQTLFKSKKWICLKKFIKDTVIPYIKKEAPIFFKYLMINGIKAGLNKVFYSNSGLAGNYSIKDTNINSNVKNTDTEFNDTHSNNVTKEEQTVSAHRQRYGKDKHWVDKKEYKRNKK